MGAVYGAELRQNIDVVRIGAGIGGRADGRDAGDGTDRRSPSGKVDWGLWIDGDGCMHWYADGGFEGYMVPRRNPQTGRAVCLKRHACLAQNTDDLFAPGSATLTKAGQAQLRAFFAEQEAQAYAVFAHSDGAGGKTVAERLTQAQAEAVAAVARDAGEQVTEAVGGGARYPKAAKGSAANRRIEMVCYR